MKYCLLGRDESHAYILDRLKAEGHEVLLLARTKTGAWEGLLERAASLQVVREWKPDIIIIDSTGFGPIAKTLADEGFKVFGGSNLQDSLQKDYLFGLGVLEAAGVPTCEHSRFTALEDAVDYLQTKDQAWAMRTSDGMVSNFPSTIALQLHLEKCYQDGEVPANFALQRGFPDNVDGGIALNPMYYLVGLFNSQGLMQPCFKMTTAHNLLPSGQGIPTYEGVNLQPIPIQDEKIQSTLKKLQPTLKTVNYTGWVWVGCTDEWDKKKNEYCTRAMDFRVSPPDGFWAALLGGLQMSVEHFFGRVLSPRKTDHANTPFEFTPGVVVSRKLTLPPYPLTEAPWLEPKERTRLRSTTPDVCVPRTPGVFWSDVAAGEGGCLQVTGPVVGYATGNGASSGEALRDLGRAVQMLKIPYLQVKCEDGLECLHLDLLPSPNGKLVGGKV